MGLLFNRSRSCGSGVTQHPFDEVVYQRTSECNVIVLHEAVVEIGVELLRRRKPASQFRGFVFDNQLADRDLQRIVIPMIPTPVFGYRHDRMGCSAPQFLRALQIVPGAKLMVCVFEKVSCSLCMLLSLHICLSALA